MNRAQSSSKVKRLQFISAKLVESLLAGNYRSVFKGPGIEFDEAREYVEGDDARLIDWNVSSRLGNVYTKTFKEEREMVIFLIVDISPSLFSGAGAGRRRDAETLLFSLITLAAVQNNDRVGACFFADNVVDWVPPRKGKKHALRLITDMLGVETNRGGSDLASALRTSGEALKRRGICFIISDFKTTGYFKELSLLGRKHDVIAVRITDPADREFPSTGLISLEDPEEGRSILALGSSKKYRKQYYDFQQNQRQQWKRECSKRRISTLEINTAEDPAFQLIQFFRRRKGR